MKREFASLWPLRLRGESVFQDLINKSQLLNTLDLNSHRLLLIRVDEAIEVVADVLIPPLRIPAPWGE